MPILPINPQVSLNLVFLEIDASALVRFFDEITVIVIVIHAAYFAVARLELRNRTGRARQKRRQNEAHCQMVSGLNSTIGLVLTGLPP